MFKITKNWYELLKPEFEKDYYKQLCSFLEQEYATKTIYPKAENIFNSLNYVKYENVKVVIIGQDPYHEPNQAHGLSFSVESDIKKLPPSLLNIFKELKDEFGFKNTNGNLACWAKQGVLLLNSVLTVERGKANSHKDKGWENLTQAIISLLNKREKPIVFILWGEYAKKLGSLIKNRNHLVLTSPHPSPFSAHYGFFGNGHFKKANEFLQSIGEEPIDWRTQSSIENLNDLF